MLEVWFFFAPFFSLPDSGLHPDANREYRYMKKSRNLKVFCSENPSVLFFNIKKKSSIIVIPYFGHISLFYKMDILIYLLLYLGRQCQYDNFARKCQWELRHILFSKTLCQLLATL